MANKLTFVDGSDVSRRISQAYAGKRPFFAFNPKFGPVELVNNVRFVPASVVPKTEPTAHGMAFTTAASNTYYRAPEVTAGSRSVALYEPVNPPVTIISISLASNTTGLSAAVGRDNGSGIAAWSVGGYYATNSGGGGTVKTSGGSYQPTPTTVNYFDPRTIPAVTILSIGPTTTRLFCGPLGGALIQVTEGATPSGSFTYEAPDQYRCLMVGGQYGISAKSTMLAAGFLSEFSQEEAAALILNPWQIFEPETIPLFKPTGTGPVTHPTTGDVVGNTATVTGSALRETGAQTHPSTGDVVGNTATVSGTALRYRAHATTGVVAGLTSNVTGSALRYRAHATTGVVAGLTSTVTGSATIQPAPGIHVTSGDVVAGIGSVTGSALHVGVHTTTGVLSGFSAEVIGAAQRSGAVIVHDTSGVLAGYDSAVTGAATNQGSMTLTPADIQAIVVALQAAVLPVDIVRVNHIDVDGTGADSDPWGPV